MTTIIEYHHKTSELALLRSLDKYWVGAYNPNMTHQNDEPNYYFITGFFDTEQEGSDALQNLTGEEF